MFKAYSLSYRSFLLAFWHIQIKISLLLDAFFCVQKVQARNFNNFERIIFHDVIEEFLFVLTLLSYLFLVVVGFSYKKI